MICEKCNKLIGKAETKTDPKNNSKKIEITYTTEHIKCKKCKASYCKDCHDKMTKCFCCGMIIKCGENE